MDLSQILAIIIFGAMFAVIIWDKYPRHYAALIGAVLMIAVVFMAVMQSPSELWKVLNLDHLVSGTFWYPGHTAEVSFGINWQTIIFIGGMMVMVAGMERAGFFRWLCLKAARIVKCRVIPLLLAFMLISGFLSMFIDSITVLLFLSIVTIELGRLLKFDPVPIIIAEVFAANVGGAASMSGDPPNIIIGTALGYNFFDFLFNTGVIAWICLIFSMVYFYFVFRKHLKQDTEPEEVMKVCPLPESAITDRRIFGLDVAIFLVVIALIVSHAQTGMSIGLVGVIAAAMTVTADLPHFKSIMRGVNWQTLLFFVGLFVCVSGLEATGVLDVIARFISRTSHGNLSLAILFILWISAFASAVIDNIPFAATMVPVISELATIGGLNQHVLAWTLALGTDMGGNGTPIGASANVVATAVAQQEGFKISWGRYLKYALPPMILVVALSHGLLLLRYA